jgi:hypothetical protein
MSRANVSRSGWTGAGVQITTSALDAPRGGFAPWAEVMPLHPVDPTSVDAHIGVALCILKLFSGPYLTGICAQAFASMTASSDRAM